MLIKCPECNKEISNSAPSCPNCGFVLKTNAGPQPKSKSSRGSKALFQFIAFGAILVALFTPKIILAIPCLVIIGAGTIALFRKEPRWFLSLGAIFIGLFFVTASSVDFDNDRDYIPNLQVYSNWSTDDYSYGYIKGRVTNNGNKTVSYFKITAQFKDKNGHIIDTDYTVSDEKLLPGASKEFEIMHKVSYDYDSYVAFIDEVRTTY